MCKEEISNNLEDVDEVYKNAVEAPVTENLELTAAAIQKGLDQGTLMVVYPEDGTMETAMKIAELTASALDVAKFEDDETGKVTWGVIIDVGESEVSALDDCNM